MVWHTEIMSQPSLFSHQERLERLQKLKNPLDDFKTHINWEIYRNELESMYSHKNGKGGRPPYDPVKMFKILFLQKLYKLSDDEMEFHIIDRMSFQRFLDIGQGDPIPDAKTIWVFRERMEKEKMLKVLFEKLNYWIQKQGKIVKQGSSIDGTLVDAPVQRNTREENETIKKGEIPEEWKDEPQKMAQKDTDADWKLKNGKSYYGYANHIVINNESKLITDFEITTASVHDSQPAVELIQRMSPDQELYADSAYHSEEIRMAMREKEIEGKIIRKKKKGSELTEEDKIFNKIVSKTRARIEHVFADIKSFGGDTIRTIGIKRAEIQIGLSVITYNIRRFSYLARA